MTVSSKASKEAFTYQDRITGRTILQLTNSDEHSVHGYYDLPPWSPTTGQIAFTRMSSARAQQGEIYVMDRDGANLTRLCATNAVSPNDGARAQWSFDGERIYYEDREQDQRLLAWVNPATGERGHYPGSLRMLSPSSPLNAYHTQCADLADHEIVRRREQHGVFVQDLTTGKTKQLVTVAECLSIHPRRSEIADWHLYVKHTKWSLDGKQIMFVFTNEIRYAEKYTELPRVKDIYVIRVDGSDLRRVGEFGNHPLWHPSGQEILSNSPFPDRPNNSLVLTHVETGERRLAARCISGTGHPSFCRDGSKIVLDHVLGGQGYGSINLVDVASDTVEHLAQVQVTNHTHTGTHLHPVWSQDGTQVLYASDASGVGQLCIIDI